MEQRTTEAALRAAIPARMNTTPLATELRRRTEARRDQAEMLLGAPMYQTLHEQVRLGLRDLDEL